ncbi:uncharacterized protein GGS22DRAFT_11968 [Annulohypoxylon maeteangense]|uniref:uncharacterized protein n=1 Tax=Annulohypoxylon maeteangense TaxID=1927788 RepID=UPI002008230D|nr:uncharacterized protein GGS22DRAFT_11968 [Annulohypoxylon maeteangense]KAI0890324.1 hypothetical protein GGS22DRAFT_11968 [Annulohypoxylon maeteangense]
MLSLASLLNPAPPGPPINRFPPSPASSSSPTASLPDESGLLDEPIMARQKIPKGTATLPTSRPKGTINFAAYQRLDEASLQQVRKFQVHPFGNIQDHSRHIPYNSTKKDFFEKTSRESFEVFQYDFKVPGDEAEYTVMWDYNVGLVRMTPFFKCCKYPKTTPAKMLNLNPGLKEITHSITGGSIMAQGYWMPYYCAKAVCATFCHNIAGALIPIFGPDFPSRCIPPEAPEYSRMIIDPAIVVQATRDAERFRRLYTNSITSSDNGGGRVSPPRDRRPLFRSPYDDPRQSHQHYRRHLVRKPFAVPTGCDSPYATDTDSDMSPVAQERGGMIHRDRFPYSPMAPPPPPPPSLVTPSFRPTSSGWTPANVVLPHHYEAPGPSPWLSAVPRFTTTAHLPPYPSPHTLSQPHPQPWRGGSKRSADHVETEFEYENNRDQGRASENSRTPTTTSPHKILAPTNRNDDGYEKNNNNKLAIDPTAVLGADKNAALLLMNLSVRDTRATGGSGAGVTSEMSSPCGGEFPRIKRVRANSM